ncbi:hypothetical protein [Vibrio owensii]|uniref:hypothetical protein n=1 Tax=Vibrio owensii TaxID=696485 RepID=UPI003CC6D6DC
MNITSLQDVPLGSAIHRYFNEGNINNKRYKLVHIGEEDGSTYAVIKYFNSSQDCYHLKIIYDMEWYASCWYVIDTDEDVNKWILSGNQELETIKAQSKGTVR